MPTSVHRHDAFGITLVTGPNSGGKTRLLQTLGLVQLLGVTFEQLSELIESRRKPRDGS